MFKLSRSTRGRRRCKNFTFLIIFMLLIYLKVMQFTYHGHNCQLWNIHYDQVTGQAILFSDKHPHCALDVRSRGLYLDVYEEGKVSQLWTYKNGRFFNQGRVMTSSEWSATTPIDTFPLSFFGSEDQTFCILKQENIKNPFLDKRVYLTR